MSDYIPRLNDSGMQGNRLWYSDNPFYNSGYGLPNCTCYAWGRFWEIGEGLAEHRPRLSLSDAENWYNFADGYERGTTPALGAVLCLADGPFSGAGHVAVVEQINDDGSILTSESAYDAYYFEVHQRYPENNYVEYPGYVFQGFIYNPYAGDHPVPPGPGNGFKWWMAKRIIELKKRGY